MSYRRTSKGENPARRAWPLVRAVTVVAVGATLSTCGGTKPDAHPVVAPTASAHRVAPSTVTAGPASASITRNAGSSAEASPKPSAEPALATLPLRSATPGKIQCETVDCELETELCCVDAGIGRCLARSSAVGEYPCSAGSIVSAEIAKLLTQERRCDESSDCRNGERCCESTEYDDACQPSSAPRWRCTTQCRSSADHSDEVCLRGSSCAAGACVVAEGAAGSTLEGYCPAATLQLSCGRVTCMGSEVCCWDPKAQNGRCAQPNSCHPNVETVQYACERPSDCGAGYDCYNTSGSYSFETYACHQALCSSTKLFDGPFLCDSKADCPTILRAAGPTLQVKAHAPASCTHSPGDPAGVKVCQYR